MCPGYLSYFCRVGSVCILILTHRTRTTDPSCDLIPVPVQVIHSFSHKYTSSDASQKSRVKEMTKMIDHGAFSNQPIEMEEARQRYPKGTYSRTYLISCMKHAELEEKDQVFKARLVVLGNKVFRMDGSRAHLVSEWSPVVSIAGIRAVMAHSCVPMTQT